MNCYCDWCVSGRKVHTIIPAKERSDIGTVLTAVLVFCGLYLVVVVILGVFR